MQNRLSTMRSPSAVVRHAWGAGAVGIVLLAATAALPRMQFGTDGSNTDVVLYERYARNALDGSLPYHGFFFEYPPLSLVALVAPALTGLEYAVAFRMLMWLLLAVSLAVVLATLVRLQAEPYRLYGAAVLLGAGPALLGPMTFERFDMWPAALLSVSLLLLTAERWTGASVLLALAVCTKLYPVVAVPAALGRALAGGGRKATTRAATAGVAAAAVVTLPFAVVGFGGLGFSYYVQFKRPLQLETVGASVLLALDRIGIGQTAVHSGLARELGGGAAVAFAFLSTLVQLATLAAVVWWFWRGPRTAASALTTAAAATICFVTFGKVLSPQYMIWLLPLAPIVARQVWAATMGLTAVAFTLTGLYFPVHYGGIVFVSNWVWVLLARNVMLVALAVVLLVHLRDEARQWRVQSENPPNVSRV